MKNPLLPSAALLVAALLFSLPSAGSSAGDGTPQLSPPGGVSAFDMPNDNGAQIGLAWDAMPYDGPDVTYVVAVAEQEAGPFEEVMRFAADTRYMSDQHWPFWAWRRPGTQHFVSLGEYVKNGEPSALVRDVRYFSKVIAFCDAGAAESVVVSAQPQNDLFNWLKLNNFVYMVIFSGIVLGFIARAKRKELFLRKIPALDAVDEAIGRATEMGKPVYFLTGRLGMSSVPTIAATAILGEVARKVAAYDTRLRVPHTDPIVMAVGQEITKEAYIKAGRPDAYQEDSNFYVTDDQFAYTAAVNGMMMREQPGAVFLMGYYYAESLLLAEVGAQVGAIQVAGTDAEHQLPFFVTACDYTLIGEELYAASAYLSKEPVLIGTLRGQDIGRAFVMACLVVGVIVATAGLVFGAKEAVAYVLELFADF